MDFPTIDIEVKQETTLAEDRAGAASLSALEKVADKWGLSRGWAYHVWKGRGN